jgi:hypothetical protein
MTSGDVSRKFLFLFDDDLLAFFGSASHRLDCNHTEISQETSNRRIMKNLFCGCRLFTNGACYEVLE